MRSAPKLCFFYDLEKNDTSVDVRLEDGHIDHGIEYKKLRKMLKQLHIAAPEIDDSQLQEHTFRRYKECDTLEEYWAKQRLKPSIVTRRRIQSQKQMIKNARAKKK